MIHQKPYVLLSVSFCPNFQYTISESEFLWRILPVKCLDFHLEETI